MIFGRPCGVVQFTCPLPTNVSDECLGGPQYSTRTLTDFSAHHHLFQLASIMREVVENSEALESGVGVSDTTQELQKISSEIDTWILALPLYLRFDPSRPFELADRSMVNVQQTLALTLLSQTTIIILRRPYLMAETVRNEVSEHTAVCSRAAHLIAGQ
jgi:hypothetical protein